MRIAVFNWRDIRNPMAGGAEVFIHQVLKRLVHDGHDATLFTSSFRGSSNTEMIDGIRHVRYGGRYSMYAKTLGCYREHIAGRYDVIVESINGVPFFTNLFAKEKVVPFIHQLTRQNWYSGMVFPISAAGYHLEDHLLRPYLGCRTMVPSASTRSDLLGIGFRDVHVVHGAADIEPPNDMPAPDMPTMIYLGRLTRSKRVDHALRAFDLIRGDIGDARLWIVGSGPEEGRLKELASDLGIAERTEFFGKVSHAKKTELLASAHLMLFPAVREGWGLVVLEANACGTPVIGYDVHGLRDSIKDGVNGYLVPSGDYNALARRSIASLEDDRSLRSLSSRSAGYARGFSWDRTAKEFLSVLEGAIHD